MSGEVARGFQTGVVKWFSKPKGYGHLVAPDGADVFVHHTVIQMEGYRALEPGQRVRYREAEGAKGRYAVEVFP